MVTSMGLANKQEIMQQLRNLKPEIFDFYKVRDMELFGSVVREEDNQNSDIDLLVDFSSDADMFDLVALALYLEEKLGHKIDVVPKHALRKELRSTVLDEAEKV